jgi:hypothetical protein
MNKFFSVPNIEEYYGATLTPIIPEYQGKKIAHGVVSTGKKTLRISGYPAIGPNGIVGKATCVPRRCRRWNMFGRLSRRRAQLGMTSSISSFILRQ